MKTRPLPVLAPVALLALAFACQRTLNIFPVAEAFAFSRTTSKIRPAALSAETSLALSSSSDNESNSNNPSRSIQSSSAAGRERRNEDLRRLARRDEVVPGKTSALPNARDYQLDPAETERQWAAHASNVERQINLHTDRGMRALKMLDLDEADEAFGKVYALKPNAYLWQAGVVKYYRNELLDAAKCFAANAATFESKFLSPASEERIWRNACELKAASNSKIRQRGKRKGEGADGVAAVMHRDIVEATAPSTPAAGHKSVSKETRKVIRIVRDLFQGSVDNDASSVALNRAKLRSICGEYGSPPTADRKKWKLSSWYYLGLHYDAMGEIDEAKACMKMALRQGASSGNGEDIINMLPFLHMSVRDWFDDDDFSLEDEDEDDYSDLVDIEAVATTSIWEKEETVTYKWSSRNDERDESSDTTKGKESQSTSTIDKTSKAKDHDDQGGARSVVKVAIEASLEKVRLTELQESLRKRGMKTSGSKSELQERLLNALLKDAGF